MKDIKIDLKMIVELLKSVHLRKHYSSVTECAVFILFVLIICTDRITAQSYDYTHLEKLVSNTEEMRYPESSENGKWLAWSIVSADGSKRMMAQNVDRSESRIERKNISFMIFVKNHLLIQAGDQVEYLDPETGKSHFLKNVSKYIYDKKHQVLAVLLNEKEGNKLQVFDSDLNLKQTIDDVQYLFSNNEEAIVRKKVGDLNEVYVLNKDTFTLTFSTKDKVNYIFASGNSERGLLIETESAVGKIINYSTLDNKQSMFDMSAYRDYELIAVNPSLSDDQIVLKLQKKIQPKAEMVDIWYGTDFNLAEHDGTTFKSVQIDWNIITGASTLMTRSGFFEETAIGNNLYLMNAVDQQQVDKMDKSGAKGSDELYLWNSLTDTYSKIIDLSINGQLFISPKGKYLVIQNENKWHLYNTEDLSSEELNSSEKMIPYFISDTDMLWVGGNRIAVQNLNSKKMVDLYRGSNNISLDLIDFDKVNTEMGYKRDFRKADLSKSLVVQITDLSTDYVSYAYLKNKKLHVIKPLTGDKITEFKKIGTKEDYFWVEENYNKRPRIIVKKGNSSPKEIYISDPANTKFEQTELIRFSYKGSDGEKIDGNLFMPLNYDKSKKYPVVVHIYERQGYITKRFLRPSFSNETGYNIALLMEDGFAVLLADISQSDKGAGISALESVNNALDKMQDIKNIDMSRIGLMGQSFGGYQTNFIATQSDRFAAYVSGASVSDVIRTYYAYNYNSHAPEYYRYEGRQYWFKSTIAEDAQKYIRNNPIMYVQNVKAPMLLWTGTNDKNVNPEGTKSMFIALRKYRKPVVALFYDKEKHTIVKPAAQKDLNLRILDWFNYHLKEKKEIPWIKKYIKGAE